MVQQDEDRRQHDGDRSRRGSRRRKPVSRSRAVVVLVAAVLSIGLGALVYRVKAPAGFDVVAVELGGGHQRWPLPVGLDTALWWDLVFIAGYGLGLWLATTAAIWVFWSPRSARLARLGRGTVVVAVVADLVENLCLALALRGEPGPRASTSQVRLLETAATASTVKWAALAPAVAVAVVGLLVAVSRLLGSLRTRAKLAAPADAGPLPLGAQALRLPPPIERSAKEPAIRVPRDEGQAARRGARGAQGAAPAAEGPAVGTPGVEVPVRKANGPNGTDVAQARWRRAYDVPGITADELAARKETEDVVAFCLSGGGIRSGSVAMGVLQTMRKELRRARYLISVSGGGYTSGAFAHLLTDAGDAELAGIGTPVHDARHAFAPGSVELDHVRRHSSYIASTATQMLVALGVLARGLVTTLALVYAPAVALGVGAAWFYHYLPVAVLPLLPNQPTGGTLKDAAGVATAAPAGAGLHIPLSAVLAVVIVSGLALALWLVQLGSSSNLGAGWQRVCAWAGRASVFMTRVAVVVTVIAVAVPVLVWAAGRVVSLADGSVGVGVSGSVGTVLLTFLTSLATLLWRKRKTIKDTVSGAGGARTVAVPNGLLQQLLVIVSVGVLTFSWLMLFGATAIATKTDLRAGHAGPSLVLAGVITLLVVVVGGTFDECSLSLHPFYRRRLASAFAVRAVNVASDEGRVTVAVPYHPGERTPLSSYAQPAKSAKPFPELVFAAAANLTGEDLTPPGLTAVSFTMGAGWVGGPDVGWVETATLERMCPDRLRRDVTVQGAVAISGAAIASAMGRFARWYQIVLAMSGARLGSWLPNPVFLGRIRAATDEQGHALDWTLPGLPRIRRATYLLRELFNVHPHEERLLQVTDGGHYENLGIVEALRRRCTTIYCVDGGGDTPPTAAGLAEAIALAESELGVRIRLDKPFDAEPGAGRKLDPQAPLAALNAALSKLPVITGRIEYPAASGLPEGRRSGVLYVARASLWPEMPYALLSYAAQNPAFPHDSTGDQWFDDGQFTAYTQLGRELGVQVLRVRKRLAARETRNLLRPGPREAAPTTVAGAAADGVAGMAGAAATAGPVGASAAAAGDGAGASGEPGEVASGLPPEPPV